MQGRWLSGGRKLQRLSPTRRTVVKRGWTDKGELYHEPEQT